MQISANVQNAQNEDLFMIKSTDVDDPYEDEYDEEDDLEDEDDEDFDLDAVPDDVLILLLNCGCCPAQLVHHLAEGDVIYAVE